MSRVTVSREPNETGLARVCQSPRGRVVKCEGRVIARVSWSRNGFAQHGGWYFYAVDEKLGIPRKNTAETGLSSDIEKVLADCLAYVKPYAAKSKTVRK